MQLCVGSNSSGRNDDDDDAVDLQQPKARKKPNTQMGRRNQRHKRQFAALPTANQQAQPPIRPIQGLNPPNTPQLGTPVSNRGGPIAQLEPENDINEHESSHLAQNNGAESQQRGTYQDPVSLGTLGEAPSMMHNEPQEDPFQVNESIIQDVELGHQVENQPDYHPTTEVRRYPDRQRVAPTRLEPVIELGEQEVHLGDRSYQRVILVKIFGSRDGWRVVVIKFGEEVTELGAKNWNLHRDRSQIQL